MPSCKSPCMLQPCFGAERPLLVPVLADIESSICSWDTGCLGVKVDCSPLNVVWAMYIYLAQHQQLRQQERLMTSCMSQMTCSEAVTNAQHGAWLAVGSI